MKIIMTNPPGPGDHHGKASYFSVFPQWPVLRGLLSIPQFLSLAKKLMFAQRQCRGNNDNTIFLTVEKKIWLIFQHGTDGQMEKINPSAIFSFLLTIPQYNREFIVHPSVLF